MYPQLFCTKQCLIPLLTEFIVTDAFLAVEKHVLPGDNPDLDDPRYTLSPASGFTVADVFNRDATEGAYWLVEPYRDFLPLQYTGALDHRIRGKANAPLMIAALEHFVYHYSNKAVVLADVQGIYYCI